MKKDIDKTTEFQRHLLGSIDLSDIENHITETEQERKEYCAVISAAFPKLEKTIKKFLYDQLMFSSNQADTWEKVIFGRGTFNGMDILYQYWKIAHNEHTAKIPKEEFDRNSPIGEV